MDGECIRTSKSDRRNRKDPDEINKSKNVTCMISIILTNYNLSDMDSQIDIMITYYE